MGINDNRQQLLLFQTWRQVYIMQAENVSASQVKWKMVYISHMQLLRNLGDSSTLKVVGQCHIKYWYKHNATEVIYKMNSKRYIDFWIRKKLKNNKGRVECIES